ncbi:MAG: Obg family GTPase CgtA [Nannocystis sp.]|nr:Obg family GTPase CgtA [Nannocystis sp.]
MEVIYVVEDQDGAEYVEADDIDDEAAPEDGEGEDDEAAPEDSEEDDEAAPEDSEEEDDEAAPEDSEEEDDEAGPEDSSGLEEQLAAGAGGDAVVDPDAPPPIKREKPARRGRGRRRRRPEPEPLQPGALLVDLVEHGQEVRIARGGRGGRGNIHFRTATNRAPYYAEPGGPGEAFWLRLELKLLADVGIVGFPNVGKSTLIRAISRARPKVGDYPFTTLVPQLGVVSLSGERSMVVADVPGLIRGASEGKGLGLDFLRHLERTRVLLHLLSPDPEEGREPLADLEALEEELSAYGSIFAGRPRVVALNKIDTPEGERLVRATRAALRRRDIPLFPISAATGAGIPELLEALWRRVELGRPKHPSGEPAVEAPQPQ